MALCNLEKNVAMAICLLQTSNHKKILRKGRWHENPATWKLIKYLKPHEPVKFRLWLVYFGLA